MTDSERIEKLSEFSRRFGDATHALDRFLEGKTTFTDADRDRLEDLENTVSGIAQEWQQFCGTYR